jgi:hypothetical protein
MQAFINDPRYAQTVGRMVEVQLFSGEAIRTGVHDVNEDEGFVSFDAPQHFGDETTTRKVALDVIASVTVTDVIW